MITKIQVIGEATDEASMSRYTQVVDDAHKPPTLGSLLAKYGVEGSEDMEIELLDGFQVKQRFSLVPFAHLDPSTYIKIQFISGPIEREFPDLNPGAFLLKEYLVAGPED
ncbi:hypothetical protein [Nocardia bovistercoris]|uniref:Uncharacterized protein n=1 Tax=Nocardia bovistercoris TaxID=2785916 RepID=A0A931N4D0_9NOCA|nr:hypothetical protein [Nocardia bovistercoris]MBH0778582.1 hypothetical protein [Nocardia bovistercoris]